MSVTNISTIEANHAKIAKFLSKSQSLFKKHIDYTEQFTLEFKELFQIGKHLESEYAELVRISLNNLPSKSTQSVIEMNQPENLEDIIDGHLISNQVESPLPKSTEAVVKMEKNQPENLEDIIDGYQIYLQVKNEPNESEITSYSIVEDAEPLTLSVEEFPENMPSDQSYISDTDSDCNLESDNNENNLQTVLPLLQTTDRKFKGDTCNKKSNSKSALCLHQREHNQSNIKITRDKIVRLTGERPFKCSSCNKRFTRSGHLKVHLRIHTGERPFKCSICKKGFTQSGGLRVHMRNHTGERPFKCSICHKGFIDSSQLRFHMTVHTNERPFKCSICDKRFVESGGLKVHMRSHTGERPFKCSSCDKGFATSSQLKRHTVVHTGERPFKCSICSKGFATSSLLKNHTVVHKRK